jgi:hypothetical protein
LSAQLTEQEESRFDGKCFFGAFQTTEYLLEMMSSKKEEEWEKKESSTVRKFGRPNHQVAKER